jgi:hypothetical protein
LDDATNPTASPNSANGSAPSSSTPTSRSQVPRPTTGPAMTSDTALIASSDAAA